MTVFIYLFSENRKALYIYKKKIIIITNKQLLKEKTELISFL